MSQPVNLPRTRFHYLDGARGIAAFTVFLYHILDTSVWHGTAFQRIWSAVFNGADAVSFFFVLSGFVLSYKYLAHKPEKLSLPLKEYVNNRIWRIYPAFVITLMIYYAITMWRKEGDFWQNVYTSRNNFIDEAELIKNFCAYNYADWTLSIELCISLMLPFLMAAVLVNKRWIVAMIILAFLSSRVINSAVFHFCLGMMLAYHHTGLSTLRQTKPGLWRWRWPIILASFVIFGFRHLRLLSEELHHFLERLNENFMITEFTLTALVSVIFIIYFFNSRRAQAVLGSAPIHFLGKISYSLYLLQGIWATSLNKDFVDFIQAHISTDPPTMYVAYVFLAGSCLIVSATLAYYLVEAPFHRLGKAISKKWLSPARRMPA